MSLKSILKWGLLGLTLASPAMAAGRLNSILGHIFAHKPSIEILGRAQTFWPTGHDAAIGSQALFVHPGLATEGEFNLVFGEHIALSTAIGLTVSDTTVELAGTSTVSHKNVYFLPIHVTANYRFLPQHAFRPYVGAGFGTSLRLNTKMARFSNEVGPCVQAGIDIPFEQEAQGWMLNINSRMTFLSANVTETGVTGTARYRINPIEFGVGIKKAF